jgi:hypothetical protein
MTAVEISADKISKNNIILRFCAWKKIFGTESYLPELR